MTVPYCHLCHFAMMDGERECPGCGRKLPASGEEDAPQQRAVPRTVATYVIPSRPAHEPKTLDAAEFESPNFADTPEAASSHSSAPDETINWVDRPQLNRDDINRMLEPARSTEELGRLGNYRVLHVIGSGGMGVVFRGEDTVLNRPVALKVMLPGVASHLANRLRFQMEAKAMAAVRSQHVVVIFTVNESRGVPYLAMEYLEGEPLNRRLHRQNKLPLPLAIRIGRETAEGLEAAHTSGLIHRDIKPSNLWLVKPRDRVVLLDFGLARAVVDDTHLTRTGVVLGTPAYMSPEQSRGAPVDQRTDIFSLGVVMYRMVSGQLPFRDSDTYATLIALSTQEARPLWEIEPSLPWPLAKLVMSMLARNLVDRPQSTTEIIERLQEIEAELKAPSIDLFASQPAAMPAPEAGARSLAYAAPAEAPTAALEPPEVHNDDVLVEPLSASIPYFPLERLHELANSDLGPYRLGAMLGRGFHGVTFRATDTRTNHGIALKVFAPDFPKTQQETTRLNTALAHASSLRHLNLVSLYAVGKTGPYCWLAQEYVEGRNVGQLIQDLNRSHRRFWELPMRLCYQVSQALEYALQHQRNHGNITPANILLRANDDEALLNDFKLQRALARSQLHARVLDAKQTAERAYLAPEQVDCDASYVDFLCDVYGLGAVLYHLLTGELVVRSDSLEDAIPKIRAAMPVKPRRINRFIPAEVETIVLRMVAKHQEDRYQTFSALLSDIRNVLDAHGSRI